MMILKMQLRKHPKQINKDIYLIKIIVYKQFMGNIGWTGIIIIAILIVILFGKGKISSIMGDLAKGIKSFKKGMSDDVTSKNEENDSNSDNSNSENK